MDNKYVQLARENGVVGAGGAGFPTHVKLNTNVEYIVVNGAECEPLMTVDQVLLIHYVNELVKTVNSLRIELGAKEVMIGIKAKHTDIIELVKKASYEYREIQIVPLGDFYPAGDEVVLVYETTKRQIPQGGIPLDCGVVVINVETLWNLWKGEEGKPLTHKWVTVAGCVSHPGTYRVPIGITIDEMLMLAGNATIDKYRIINGGPMMGKLVESGQEPVTKTTKGLLVLPVENPTIINRLRPIENILKQAKSYCCQCRMCTDLCPRNLLGYEIHPNKTIYSASYNWKVGAEFSSEVLLCSECGACDMFACPMGLSPRRINSELKGILNKERIPVPNKGRNVKISRWREYRYIPTKRLVKKLALENYKSPVIWIKNDWEPDTVNILLKQHIGTPSKPVVQIGDKVECGQLIASIPEKNIGSNMFASINGTVTEITDISIKIKKGKVI